MKITRLILALLVSMAVLNSCDMSSESTTDETEMDDSLRAEDIQVEEVDPEQNSFLYALPSPLQVASIFRRSGLTYIPDITNDPSNVSNYNTKLSQKLNFGVYTADLAYASLNDQNQACIDYVKSLSVLSEGLWMTNIFASVSVLERFQNNLGNSDSLGYIIADFQMEMDSYLEENGLSQNSVVIFAGAWVESMYIALATVKDKDNPELIGRIIEQEKVIKGMISVLEQENENGMQDFLAKLKVVGNHFERFDIDSQQIETVEELSEIGFTAEEKTQLLEDVSAVRAYIVNG